MYSILKYWLFEQWRWKFNISFFWKKCIEHIQQNMQAHILPNSVLALNAWPPNKNSNFIFLINTNFLCSFWMRYKPSTYVVCSRTADLHKLRMAYVQGKFRMFSSWTIIFCDIWSIRTLTHAQVLGIYRIFYFFSLDVCRACSSIYYCCSFCSILKDPNAMIPFPEICRSANKSKYYFMATALLHKLASTVTEKLCVCS